MKVVTTQGKAFVQLHDRLYSIGEAHELVASLCVALGVAQGHQDVLDGKMPDTKDCPNCKARNMTASHVCKRRTARKR
jgi:hypothetical protein